MSAPAARWALPAGGPRPRPDRAVPMRPGPAGKFAEATSGNVRVGLGGSGLRSAGAAARLVVDAPGSGSTGCDGAPPTGRRCLPAACGSWCPGRQGSPWAQPCSASPCAIPGLLTLASPSGALPEVPCHRTGRDRRAARRVPGVRTGRSSKTPLSAGAGYAVHSFFSCRSPDASGRWTVLAVGKGPRTPFGAWRCRRGPPPVGVRRAAAVVGSGHACATVARLRHPRPRPRARRRVAGRWPGAVRPGVATAGPSRRRRAVGVVPAAAGGDLRRRRPAPGRTRASLAVGTVRAGRRRRARQLAGHDPGLHAGALRRLRVRPAPAVAVVAAGHRRR